MTRTRVARVRAEYPNQLDYSGVRIKPPGKCHAAYQAIVDYQLHGVRYRAAALRRAPSPLHARRPNPEPHEHGTCGQHVPVSRRPASLHAPRHRRGALLPPRSCSTQYTPRPRRVDHVARPAPWMAGAGRSHGRARRTRAWPTPWCPTVAARGVSPALARRGAHVARPATATGACDGVVSIHIGVATTSAPRGSLPCAMQPHMRQGRTRGCAKGRGATASEPAAVPPPSIPPSPCASLSPRSGRPRHTPRPTTPIMSHGMYLGWQVWACPWARMLHTRVAYAPVRGHRHVLSGARALASRRVRAMSPRHCQCVWRGGADAHGGGPWRRHSARRY